MFTVGRMSCSSKTYATRMRFGHAKVSPTDVDTAKYCATNHATDAKSATVQRIVSARRDAAARAAARDDLHGRVSVDAPFLVEEPPRDVARPDEELLHRRLYSDLRERR
jgi:hypothetical protein